MKLIVGLGNPGKEFKGTRHNVGYEVCDIILKEHPVLSRQKKFFSYIFSGKIKEQKIILLKPLTFMNLSGESVAKVVNFFKIPTSEILVVCDDFNLPLGKIRMRAGGSSGGHKGLSSIISHLKSDKFWRCRVGINSCPGPVSGTRNGHGQRSRITDFVLGKFEKEEKEIIKKVEEEIARIITEDVWRVASWQVFR